MGRVEGKVSIVTGAAMDSQKFHDYRLQMHSHVALEVPSLHRDRGSFMPTSMQYMKHPEFRG